jgi:hypothetical protein
MLPSAKYVLKVTTLCFENKAGQHNEAENELYSYFKLIITFLNIFDL